MIENQRLESLNTHNITISTTTSQDSCEIAVRTSEFNPYEILLKLTVDCQLPHSTRAAASSGYPKAETGFELYFTQLIYVHSHNHVLCVSCQQRFLWSSFELFLRRDTLLI